MRVVLYARVSKADGDQNPESQLYHLRSYAENHGWEVVGEYIDQASAKDLRGRVAWRDLMARIQRGGIDAILVMKLDRAFRSSMDTHQGIAHLQDHLVDFVAITQPIDTTTSTGKLQLAILAAVAEFERDLIVERTKEGMARARAEGKRIGRPPGKKDSKPRRVNGYYARYHHKATKYNGVP